VANSFGFDIKECVPGQDTGVEGRESAADAIRNASGAAPYSPLVVVCCAVRKKNKMTKSFKDNMLSPIAKQEQNRYIYARDYTLPGLH
jgi:hypothetical protein